MGCERDVVAVAAVLSYGVWTLFLCRIVPRVRGARRKLTRAGTCRSGTCITGICLIGTSLAVPVTKAASSDNELDNQDCCFCEDITLTG